jgi:light-harvesting complex 1 alpha chain
MWRIWVLFDARRALVAMAIFLFSLAVLIHFILLSTNRYQWIDNSGPTHSVSAKSSATPPAAPGTSK